LTKIDLLGTEIKNDRTVLFAGGPDHIMTEQFITADSWKKRLRGKRIFKTLLTSTKEEML
jgi:hypothetical protein